MAKNDARETYPKTDHTDPKHAEKRDEPRKGPALDFTKLDLSIEKVEERISPSETNVFDK